MAARWVWRQQFGRKTRGIGLNQSQPSEKLETTTKIKQTHKKHYINSQISLGKTQKQSNIQ